MKEEDFVKLVIEKYEEARYIDEKIAPLNVVRGGSRPIYADAEDLFACYMGEQLSSMSNVCLYVNQTFTFSEPDPTKKAPWARRTAKTYSFKPDIAFVKDRQVRALVDLKMDMGWMRRQKPEQVNANDVILSWVGGRSAKLTNRFTSLADVPVEFSKSVFRYFVVVSDKNIGRARLERNKELFKQMTKNSFHFLITEGPHPNSYQHTVEERFNEVKAASGVFDELVAGIRSHLE